MRSYDWRLFLDLTRRQGASSLGLVGCSTQNQVRWGRARFRFIDSGAGRSLMKLGQHENEQQLLGHFLLVALQQV